jgi:hypothetical protein
MKKILTSLKKAFTRRETLQEAIYARVRGAGYTTDGETEMLWIRKGVPANDLVFIYNNRDEGIMVNEYPRCQSGRSVILMSREDLHKIDFIKPRI